MERDDKNLDKREIAILAAAFEVFGRYGFRRSAMSDIAKAAEISRATLYLRYNSKEEVFRALVAKYFERVIYETKAALRQDQSVVESLQAAFAVQTGEEFERILTSPHGEELLGTKSQLAGELVSKYSRHLERIYAAWLAEGVREHRFDLHGEAPELIARTIVEAAYSAKSGRANIADIRAAHARLAGLIGRGLVR